MKWWRDARVRGIIWQVVLFLAVVWFGWSIYDNTITNLESRGITTGFRFLNEEAGFAILQTLIPFDESYTFGRTFLVGLLNTLLVSFIGVICATLLGFLVGIARLSSNWLVQKLASVYIEIFRNIPLLLQIFFWYFAVLQALPGPRQSMSLGEVFFLNVRGLYLPSIIQNPGFGWVWIALAVGLVAGYFYKRHANKVQNDTGKQLPGVRVWIAAALGLPAIALVMTGMPFDWEIAKLQGFNFQGGITIIPELGALALALTVYTATYIAEIVRSGIQAVDKGQTEAASALGLHNWQILRLVVIPQAMRVIIPPLSSQYMNLIKNSSLATAIGYPDLVSVFAGTTLNQTGQAVEIIFMTMGVYLTTSLIVSVLMNMYNRKVALVER
ncbi:amino acid ABC transporter permease [Pelagibaculum spongiae]|uniref:Amino acid ABC transporter permease n=1 Tax=Pelagibaculum spongiae TaxID=2080658 RepID=A0A2V1GY52_9GAMM|nr:amino acid ABC transporter permease [Pelagibaculum spongiae]PVZ65484.1 amino acid ABC transporter permease [Pelagibaculum spongiae]